MRSVNTLDLVAWQFEGAGSRWCASFMLVSNLLPCCRRVKVWPTHIRTYFVDDRNGGSLWMGPWRADFVHPQTMIASSSSTNVSLLTIMNILVQKQHFQNWWDAGWVGQSLTVVAEILKMSVPCC